MRAILTYHSIDDSGSPISIARDVFARHVTWLAGGRVAVEPLTTLMTGSDTAPDGRDRVAVTFDDAFENFGTIAWPQLSAAGLPATVFVVSGHVGQTNRWGGAATPGVPELPLLTWDALGACAAGGAAIGAHSRTHPHLSRLSASARRDELAGCKADIAARLGTPPRAFAYPYGDLSDSVVADTTSLFGCACTTEYRPVAPSDSVHRLPRLDMWYFQGSTALTDFGSAAFLRRISRRRVARALRKWWTTAKSTTPMGPKSL